MAPDLWVARPSPPSGRQAVPHEQCRAAGRSWAPCSSGGPEVSVADAAPYPWRRCLAPLLGTVSAALRVPIVCGPHGGPVDGCTSDASQQRKRTAALERCAPSPGG